MIWAGRSHQKRLRFLRPWACGRRNRDIWLCAVQDSRTLARTILAYDSPTHASNPHTREQHFPPLPPPSRLNTECESAFLIGSGQTTPQVNYGGPQRLLSTNRGPIRRSWHSELHGPVPRHVLRPGHLSRDQSADIHDHTVPDAAVFPVDDSCPAPHSQNSMHCAYLVRMRDWLCRGCPGGGAGPDDMETGRTGADLTRKRHWGDELSGLDRVL